MAGWRPEKPSTGASQSRFDSGTLRPTRPSPMIRGASQAVAGASPLHRAKPAFRRASSLSDVEAHVEDVTVLDHVALAFESLLASASSFRVRAACEEIVPANHLAADEPAGDV